MAVVVKHFRWQPSKRHSLHYSTLCWGQTKQEKFAGTLMGHLSLLLMCCERAQPAHLTLLTGGFRPYIYELHI